MNNDFKTVIKDSVTGNFPKFLEHDELIKLDPQYNNTISDNVLHILELIVPDKVKALPVNTSLWTLEDRIDIYIDYLASVELNVVPQLDELEVLTHFIKPTEVIRFYELFPLYDKLQSGMIRKMFSRSLKFSDFLSIFGVNWGSKCIIPRKAKIIIKEIIREVTITVPVTIDFKMGTHMSNGYTGELQISYPSGGKVITGIRNPWLTYFTHPLIIEWVIRVIGIIRTRTAVRLGTTHTNGYNVGGFSLYSYFYNNVITNLNITSLSLDRHYTSVYAFKRTSCTLANIAEDVNWSDNAAVTINGAYKRRITGAIPLDSYLGDSLVIFSNLYSHSTDDILQLSGDMRVIGNASLTYPFFSVTYCKKVHLTTLVTEYNQNTILRNEYLYTMLSGSLYGTVKNFINNLFNPWNMQVIDSVDTVTINIETVVIHTIKMNNLNPIGLPNPDTDYIQHLQNQVNSILGHIKNTDNMIHIICLIYNGVHFFMTTNK